MKQKDSRELNQYLQGQKVNQISKTAQNKKENN